MAWISITKMTNFYEREKMNLCWLDLFYGQSASRVTSFFEIGTEFWNLHHSFEHRQRDFRIPGEFFLVIDGMKPWIVHCITALYISKTTTVSSWCVFYRKISREIFKNAGHYKVEFERYFILGNTVDCNINNYYIDRCLDRSVYWNTQLL